MTKQEVFQSAIEVCDIHANRISLALDKLGNTFPVTLEKLEKLDYEALSGLELMTSRFAKLQDLIGSKIFPLTLEFLGEHTSNMSLIDVLNRLEKLEYIKDRYEWTDMRETRNHVTHEYPDKPELMVSNLNQAHEQARELVLFWTDFKPKALKILGGE